MHRVRISEPTDSKSTTVMQRQEGSLFIPSALGPKSHPAQGNPTRAPNKGLWRLIYRQFFVSVTGVAGVTCLARQDERISCLFLLNMTEVLEPIVWSLTILYMFQCHSPKSCHPLPLPQSPKDCSIHLCIVSLFCISR